MVNMTHLKLDLKQMQQEPIMFLFALLSLLLIGVFKLIITYGTPIILDLVHLNLLNYEVYILSLVYMLQPMMLGMVIGFFMLDEKDAKIFELLRVTPLGLSGYLMNRLLIPILLNGLYTLIGYLTLGQHIHSAIYLIPIIIFSSIQMVGVGIFIAIVSEDKVKGLTYSKAISGLIIFGFVNLIPNVFLNGLGRFFPQYYITEILVSPSLLILLVGLTIHCIWLFFISRSALKRL
ncbi:MAG: hypothetical protein JEZ08_05885 [Clostridiales bacterium]|nr:hypothetical protein [Clostridiales bacterium]